MMLIFSMTWVKNFIYLKVKIGIVCIDNFTNKDIYKKFQHFELHDIESFYYFII